MPCRRRCRELYPDETRKTLGKFSKSERLIFIGMCNVEAKAETIQAHGSAAQAAAHSNLGGIRIEHITLVNISKISFENIRMADARVVSFYHRWVHSDA